MADRCQKRAFQTAAFLCRLQAGFELFAFDNRLGDAVQEEHHDEYEDTASEQDPCHDDVRRTEDPHCHIARKEQAQKHNGNVQDPAPFVPFLPITSLGLCVLTEDSVSDKADDIHDHQGASRDDRCINDMTKHTIPLQLL